MELTPFYQRYMAVADAIEENPTDELRAEWEILNGRKEPEFDRAAAVASLEALFNA